MSDYSSIISTFSLSDISFSASTSNPDLSSCPSTTLSFKTPFSPVPSRKSASIHSFYGSQSSNLSTITVPLTWTPEKPLRSQKTLEEDEQRNVICIKISQEAENELDSVNIQDDDSQSLPPHPVSPTWPSFHSNDENAYLGITLSSYEEDYEAFNEIAEYTSKSLNRKLFSKRDSKENHHLLRKLDNLRTRQRNQIIKIYLKIL